MADFQTNIFSDLTAQGIGLVKENIYSTLNAESYIGGGVLFAASAEAVDALKTWIKTLTYVFGNHTGTSEYISGILDNPLISPLAPIVKTPEMNGMLEKASSSEIPYVGLLEKLPESVMTSLTNKVKEDPFLGNFIKPESPLGSFLGFEKKPVDVQVEELPQKKSKSLLDTVEEIVPSATIGLKEFEEDGIVKTIESIPGQMTNKWLKVKNFEEFGSVVGEVTDYAKKIVGSVSNLAEGFSNTITTLIDTLSRENNFVDSVKSDAFGAAHEALDTIKDQVPNLQFTMLLIPTQKGGTKGLRILLSNMIKEGVSGLPKLNPEAALFPIVILFQAPFKEVVDAQLSAFTSQFNDISV